MGVALSVRAACRLLRAVRIGGGKTRICVPGKKPLLEPEKLRRESWRNFFSPTLRLQTATGQ